MTMAVPFSEAVCCLCGRQTLLELLDFGKQPLCNRFLDQVSGEEYLHPLVVAQCNDCGLIQLINPAPAEALKPLHDWIVYSEPEAHVKTLATAISSLPGLTADSTICGLSVLDRPLLNCLKEMGFGNQWTVSLAEDLAFDDPRAGTESIQARLNPERVRQIVHKRDRPKVAVGSYIAEHAHDLREFMNSLKELVGSEGYIVTVVPDCQRVLERFDFSMLWEEHALYFTEQSLLTTFAFTGLATVYLERFGYELEDCLMSIVQPSSPSAAFPSEQVLRSEKRRGEVFADLLFERRDELQRILREHRQKVGPVALFGAGHRSAVFINLLELKDFIDFVVDDHPRKQNLYMPGSRLPILGSSTLLDRGVKLCLLSVSPESEGKIIRNNATYLQQGGVFSSIYPDSKYALFN